MQNWATEARQRWAFSYSNAGAYYARFGSRPEDLDQLHWDAIAALDFRDKDVAEHKQAELLIHERFPVDLVERIGVYSVTVLRQATELVFKAGHRPVVEVHPQW